MMPSAFGGGTVMATLKSAKDSLYSATRIKSPVTPVRDPIKLDNQPSNVNTVAADLHYHAGRVFETQNSLDVAASHYRDALARTPNDVRLLTSYARVQDRMGNIAEADTLYRRAIDLNPNDAASYNDLAMCHARHGKLDIALGTLPRAIRLEPQNKLYRNNLAVVLVDSGRPEEAFEQLAAVHGEAIAHYNLGYLLLERNSRDAAAAHFRRALELNPQLNAAQQLLQELHQGAVQAGVLPAPQAAPAVQAQVPSHPALTRLPNTSPSSNLAGGFGNAVR
jgi:tetratricopeptide (TPR) repeat protein